LAIHRSHYSAPPSAARHSGATRTLDNPFDPATLGAMPADVLSPHRDVHLPG